MQVSVAKSVTHLKQDIARLRLHSMGSPDSRRHRDGGSTRRMDKLMRMLSSDLRWFRDRVAALAACSLVALTLAFGLFPVAASAPVPLVTLSCDGTNGGPLLTVSLTLYSLNYTNSVTVFIDGTQVDSNANFGSTFTPPPTPLGPRTLAKLPRRTSSPPNQDG